jgi:hypothetical protein
MLNQKERRAEERRKLDRRQARKTSAVGEGIKDQRKSNRRQQIRRKDRDPKAGSLSAKEIKIVVRFLSGRTVKGHSLDFSSNKDGFHLIPRDGSGLSEEVRFNQVKAVFFVRDFIGNREYDERKEFDGTHPAIGKKMRVLFMDGETLTGIAEIYMPNRKGFILFPADPGSNTEKVFVVNAAVREVTFVN